MAMKHAFTKSQSIRDYVHAHPEATSREIVAALEEQGITITLGHVATIKMMADAKKAAPPKKPAATLTQDQVKMIAQAIKRIHLRLECWPNT